MTASRLRIVRVDGRKMYVCGDDNPKARIHDNAPHSENCIGRLQNVHGDELWDLTAFKRLCQVVARLGGVRSALEMFGGSGWHSSLIQTIVRPRSHEAWDWAVSCVRSIKKSLPMVHAFRYDSYRSELPEVDWVHADFNTYTFANYQDSRLHRDTMWRIVNASRRFLSFTDSALFGLVRYPKNRIRYEHEVGSFGSDVNRYYKVWVREMGEFGFGLRGLWLWKRNAGRMLFQRGYTGRPADPVTIIEPEVKVEVLR